MKKIVLLAVALLTMGGVQAQKAYLPTNMGSNWSLGVDGGVTTPLAHGTSFIGDMRGAFGLHLQKQISPVFALGVEGSWAVNTSTWSTKQFTTSIGNVVTLPGHSSTAIDQMYVGVYAGVNLFNLFGGYNCNGRLFDMELVGGLGWGHDFYNALAFYPYDVEAQDQNYVVSKAGLNFNFHVCKNFTVSLKPSVTWNVTGTHYQPLDFAQSSVAYIKNKAAFNCMVGLTYDFGPGFECVEAADPNEIANLNQTINDLRAAIDAEAAAQLGLSAANADLLKKIEQAKKPVEQPAPAQREQVMCVFYKVNSSAISRAQMTNVARVAEFLKSNPEATVDIEGFTSTDGPKAFNDKLAAARAESVKKALITKYGIAESRVKAVGRGETAQLSKLAWNRVSICTVND